MSVQQRIEEAAQKMLEHDNYETLILPAMLTEAIKVISELEERMKALENKEKSDHERIVQV